jgi:hypothetical protein
MVYLILSQLSLVLLLLGWGNLGSIVISNFWDGLSSKLITGIVFIGLFSSLYAFLLPLNQYYEIGILLIGLLGLVKHRKNLFSDLKIISNKTFLLFGAILIAISTFAPFINDHFSYYIPTIKWMNEYGLVKGISNVDLILGQQSTWHIFQASIDYYIDPYLRVNCTLLLIFILYSIENKKKELLLLVPLFLLFIHSPSPDLILYTLSIIVVLELLKSTPNYSSLWIIGLFVFTIKPTLFWLPLFIFSSSVKSNFKELIKPTPIVISSLILISFFAKQLWCFGDIIFPLHTNLSNLDWKPNAILLDISNQNALLKTFDLQYSLTEINSWNILEKLVKWFTLRGFKSVIHVSILLILLVFVFFMFIRKNKQYFTLWACIVLKTIVVFCISGQYRFMLDGILLLVVVMILSLKIKERYFQWSSIVGCGFVFLLFLFPSFLQQHIRSFYVGQLMAKPEITQIVKPIDYSISDYSKHRVTNFDFYTPNNYHLMLDTPIPCIIPYNLNEYKKANLFPFAYDSTQIGNGFYSKSLSKTELKKLDRLISIYSKTKPID